MSNAKQQDEQHSDEVIQYLIDRMPAPPYWANSKPELKRDMGKDQPAADV